MIRLDGVHKSYGSTKVIEGLDLQIEEGRSICILGRSGCGKSTLLKLIALIARPDSGEVLVNERSVNAMSDAEMSEVRRKSIAYSFQEPLLIPYISALENATIMTGATKSRAMELLGLLGLSERLSYHPSQLSGGEKKRVDLARALLKGSPVLVADEPLSNLDPDIGSEAMELLLTHVEKGGSLVFSAVEPSQTKFAVQVVNMG